MGGDRRKIYLPIPRNKADATAISVQIPKAPLVFKARSVSQAYYRGCCDWWVAMVDESLSKLLLIINRGGYC